MLQAAELLAIPLQRAVDAGDDRVVDLPEPVVAVDGLLALRVAAGKLALGITIRLPDGGKDAIALAALQLHDAALPRLPLKFQAQIRLLGSRLNQFHEQTWLGLLGVRPERHGVIAFVANAQPRMLGQGAGGQQGQEQGQQ